MTREYSQRIQTAIGVGRALHFDRLGVIMSKEQRDRQAYAVAGAYLIARAYAVVHSPSRSSAERDHAASIYSTLLGRHGDPKPAWLKREARRQYREMVRRERELAIAIAEVA